MDDLTTFVAARLDEDERYALGALNDRHPVQGSGLRIVDGKLAIRPSAASEALTSHLVRHDPARVLREVAAKRAIVALYEDVNPAASPDWYAGISETVYELAAVWSNHPDYRAEWRAERQET